MDRENSLKGLRGLNEISEEERKKFYLDNAEKLKKYSSSPKNYRLAAERIYENQKFKNIFGEDIFNQLNDGSKEAYEYRNSLTRNKIITDAFKNSFSSEGDYALLASQLDEQGMLDLLNSDYTGTVERKKRFEENQVKYSKAGQSLASSYNNPVNPTTFGLVGYGAVATRTAFHSLDIDKDLEEKDNEIKEKLFAETQERRENQVSDLTNKYYTDLLKADENGTQSLAESYSSADKLIQEKSNHFKAFKDSKWLKEYSYEDRLKDCAKYYALKETYGEGVADMYLERMVQDRIADAQDGEWTGNTLKKIFTTMGSDLGSNIAIWAHAGDAFNPTAMGIWNQGKKPIYDKDGNIIGSEENDAVWTNPAYWNNVYKYNAWSPEYHKLVEEMGGISEDVNVRHYGHIPDFVSWESVQEGLTQLGHVASFGVETYLTGGIGKGVGMGAKAAMKSIGLSAKTMTKASKVGNITNDLFVTSTAGASGAQMEAMGTFDEQMLRAKEKIQNQIKQELKEYQQSIDFNTPESQTAIADYYYTLKKQDQRRVAQQSTEGKTAFPLDDKVLKEQARRMYENDLLKAKNTELEELHKKDELEAVKAASKAYATNFVMNWVKDAAFDMTIHTYKYAKGTLNNSLDNYWAKNIISNEHTGGVKRKSRATSKKNLAWEITKQFGGGFLDEYADGMISSFSNGVGDNEFNNYINRTYNPENYNAATEGLIGNIVAGIYNAEREALSRDNLYEGFLGMLAPGVMWSIRPDVAFHPKDTWKALVGGVDENGNTLNWLERTSSILQNPLLNTYADLKAKDRATDEHVAFLNTVILGNKDKLHDAAKLIGALDTYNSPLQRNKYNFGEETSDYDPTFLDSKDQKLYNTIALMEVLKGLDNIQGAEASTVYSDAIKTINGLAEGTLSKEELNEEIDRFLADTNNKSILESDNAREIAAERLQKNAQYFVEMQQKMDDIYNTFDKNPKLANIPMGVKQMLVYNLLAEEDYIKRLEGIEKELGYGTTDYESSYTPNLNFRYGTTKAKINALEVRQRSLVKSEDERMKVRRDIIKIEDKINSLKEEAKRASNREIKEAKNIEIQKQETLLKAKSFEYSSMKERTRLIEEEIESLKDIIDSQSEGFEQEFTEGDILFLDARDRAELFNPANSSNYSKKQLKVIDRTKKYIQKYHPDGLQKIHDAGILANRISDISTTYDKLMNNDELAAAYLSAVEQTRLARAMSESLERGIQERFGKIEKAWINRYGKKPINEKKRQKEFKDVILNTSSMVLDAYMEEHPEQADDIRPYYEMIQFNEDATAIIKQSNASDTDKIRQISILHSLQEEVNSKEELISRIETIIDNRFILPELKKAFNELLSSLEKLGYQRDAVTIENREKKAKREEENKKAIEKEKARLEAEAEAAKKRKEAKEKKDVLNNVEDVDLDILNAPEEEVKDDEKSGDETQQNNDKDVKDIVEEKDDFLQSPSPDIKQQLKENSSAGKGVYITNSTGNTNTEHIASESRFKSDSTILSGNAIPLYDSDVLYDESVRKKRKGKKDDDPMNQYFAWLDAAGIKLQNIIDTELGQIIQRNPHAKVKFMSVNPVKNATKDNTVQSHLFLVLDYDNSINKNITNIHDDANGGVIETNGKKYLIIGVAGYGDKNKKENQERLGYYDILYGKNRNAPHGIGLAIRGRVEFFNNHPTERFYVPENLSTEIVDHSIIPGRIVKRLNKSDTEDYRNISELLNDPDRNPLELDLESLAWGIQEYEKFLTIGTTPDKTLIPKDSITNAGRAFVLIPASNGKMVPSYLKPLFYKEINNGTLKNKIKGYLDKLVSPNYADRVSAVTDLCRIFYFEPQSGNNILVGTDTGRHKNQISLIMGGKVFKTISLDNFNRSEFMSALEEMNPRINITATVLRSPTLLKEYDEAGALKTDAALLHTIGSNYEIHGLNPDGTMIELSSTNNNTNSRDTSDSKKKRQIVYKSSFYIYDITEGNYYLNNSLITDSDLISSLDYNRRTMDLSPVETNGAWRIYILGTDENPEVIKINKNTQEVKVLSKEQAQRVIDKVAKEKAEKEREEAARLEMERLNEMQNRAIEEGTITYAEGGLAIDFSTGEAVLTSSEDSNEEKENEEETPIEPQNNNNTITSGGKVGGSDSGTITLTELSKSKMYRNIIMDLYDKLEAIWPDFPLEDAEINDFLRKRNIEVDAIENTDAAIKAWIKTVEDCR